MNEEMAKERRERTAQGLTDHPGPSFHIPPDQERYSGSMEAEEKKEERGDEEGMKVKGPAKAKTGAGVKKPAAKKATPKRKTPPKKAAPKKR